MSVALPAVRDVKWLTLEVCRQFQRGSCSRRDSECKFAHPPKSCHVDNGHVIACFDFLKGQCLRESCKYLHPPSHLKAQLEINGRNNLIQQKMATMLQQMHFVLPGSSLSSLASFPVTQSLGVGPGISYTPYIMPVSHGIGLINTEMLPSNHQVIIPSAPRVLVQTSNANHQKVLHSDKMEVCREFQRGSCCRGETDCRFAHPTDSTVIDSADNTVTVCMDHVRGNCNRDKCKYFHPTAHQHLQLQTRQTLSPAATATNQSSAKILKRHLETSVDMAAPRALLAKRVALEPTGGVGGLFNCGTLSFQQTVSPAPLHTATAMLPTVPMMLGAPAVPAVSPYVAAASTNASQFILK
ncbi:muscleblind-like protein 2 isoform X1 [Cyprinus carpio]|uniref:Muscleblind like splicing regulator 2 n=3 Tax=Cyprinus carpio TaxID=7962 RepID=A0A8C1N100_CYPCA|nr:muscleblind-like protein 2 isoform X1 [Cyprinus carpio]XP_042619148.1 muscleblind-like protein 2 isoform X1 [Cyprinus carpio]